MGDVVGLDDEVCRVLRKRQPVAVDLDVLRRHCRRARSRFPVRRDSSPGACDCSMWKSMRQFLPISLATYDLVGADRNVGSASYSSSNEPQGRPAVAHLPIPDFRALRSVVHAPPREQPAKRPRGRGASRRGRTPKGRNTWRPFIDRSAAAGARRGQGLVEYVVLIALIALTLFAAICSSRISSVRSSARSRTSSTTRCRTSSIS